MKSLEAAYRVAARLRRALVAVLAKAIRAIVTWVRASPRRALIAAGTGTAILLLAVGAVAVAAASHKDPAHADDSSEVTPVAGQPTEDVSAAGAAAAAIPMTDAQPESWTTALAGKLRQEDTYRNPSDRERSSAVAAFREVLTAPSRESTAPGRFRSLGFTVAQGTDRVTDREFLSIVCPMEPACPGWGVVLVDLSTPIRMMIEVPHPRADLNTEAIGLSLFRKAPGSVLLMAGAHRRAASGKADVAHNASSMFNAFASVVADRGIAQVQVHGFADASRPDTDVIVSTGQGTASSAAQRLVAAAAKSDLAACAAWDETCGRLEGTKNVQAAYAAKRRSPFLHVEVSARVRGSDALRAKLVADLAESDLAAA